MASEKQVPPYIPWETFTGFIARLKSTKPPSRLDNTVMPSSMSGTVRAQVISALRFLGLVGDNNHVTDALRKLVEVYDTKEWTDTVLDLIDERYRSIKGDLDLTEATPGQLDEKFEEAGITGQMREKCIRFFLAALGSVGFSLSSHLLVRRKKKAQGRKPSARPNGRKRHEQPTPSSSGHENGADGPTRSADDRGTGEDEHPPGLIEHPLYFKGKPSGCIRVPKDLNEQDCAVIELTLAVLKAYAAQGGPAEKH